MVRLAKLFTWVALEFVASSSSVPGSRMVILGNVYYWCVPFMLGGLRWVTKLPLSSMALSL